MRDFFFLGDKDRGGLGRDQLQLRRQPAINAPTVILLAIAIMVVVHFFRTSLSPIFNQQLVYSFAFIPARFGHFSEAVSGIGDVPFLFGPGGRWLTPFTHALLHADYMHLAFNSVWLLAFGTPVARRIGTIRFGVLFVLCAIAGAGAQFAADPTSIVPVIGASGAIAGLMGGAARFMFSRPLFSSGDMTLGWPERLPVPIAPLWDKRVIGFTLVWCALNVVLGLMGPMILGEGQLIAWQAHLGGFFMGLLILPLLDPHRFPRR